MVHTVIAKFVAKPDQGPALAALLREAASHYRKDKLTLDWYILQDAKDPLKFAAVERYVNNKAALAEHAGNPYFKTFGKAIGPLIAAKPELQFLDEIDEDKAKL
ncbi:uncharacterized protein LOC62_06G007843 [Vanrija pseudolonga]|uniref:ABM domain-containing protein n=1 Tax=Vanrija pseudolonga TaxID=143232 RepID=A0AAF0YI07_9TREE|nr:hypothetical protein LOC62_06G007843 [Vanrija pseudolonga]